MATNRHAEMDRQLMKEQAQLEREIVALPPPEEEPKPLFGDPYRKHYKDPTSLRIRSVLGDFTAIQDSLRVNSNVLTGVPKAPQTPLASQPEGGLSFPTQEVKNLNTEAFKNCKSNLVGKDDRRSQSAKVTEYNQGQSSKSNSSTEKEDHKPKRLYDKKEHKSRHSVERDSTLSKTKDHRIAREHKNVDRERHKEQARKSVEQDKRTLHGSRKSSDREADVRSSHDASTRSDDGFRPPASRPSPASRPLIASSPVASRPLIANGALNGLVKSKPRLEIISQGTTADGQPELENILQEMKHLQPPLTGIQTPHKAISTSFPFTQATQDKHVTNLFHKGSSDKVPVMSTGDAVVTPVDDSLHDDLELSDSDNEDNETRKSVSVDESSKMIRQRRLSTMSSSGSSASGSSSESESEESSEASDSGAETEPASQEVQTSWKLDNFIEKKEKSNSPPDRSHNCAVSVATSLLPDDSSAFTSKNRQQFNDEVIQQIITNQDQDDDDVDHMIDEDPDSMLELDCLEKERDERLKVAEMLSSPENKYLWYAQNNSAEKQEERTLDKYEIKSDKKKSTPRKSSHKNVKQEKEKPTQKNKKTNTSESSKTEDGLKLKIKVPTKDSPAPSSVKISQHQRVACKSPRNSLSSPDSHDDDSAKLEESKPPTKPRQYKKTTEKKSTKSPKASSKSKLNITSREFVSTSDDSSDSDFSEVGSDASPKIFSNNLSQSPRVKSSPVIHSEIIREVKDRPETMAEVKVRSETMPEVKVRSETMPEVKVRSETMPEVKVRSETMPEVKVRSETMPEVKVSLTLQEENNNKRGVNDKKKSLLLSPDAIRVPEPLISPIYDSSKNGISYFSGVPSVLVKLDLNLVSELLGKRFQTKTMKRQDSLSGSSDSEGEIHDDSNSFSSMDKGSKNKASSDRENDFIASPAVSEPNYRSKPNVRETLHEAEDVKMRGNDENHERTSMVSLGTKQNTDSTNDVLSKNREEIPTNLPKIPKKRKKSSKDRDEESRSRSRESDVKKRKSSSRDKDKKDERKRKASPSSVKSKESKKDRHGNERRVNNQQKSKSDEQGTSRKEKSYSDESKHPSSSRVNESPNYTNHNRNKLTEEKLESTEFFRKEAKSLKHEADKMSSSVSKSITYIEAVVSFMLCAGAMEHDTAIRNHQTIEMYEGTLRLILHVCKFRGTPDSSGINKRLQVLSLRLQSFIASRLYKLKRSDARGLKRVIDDYNKMQQIGIKAPSPCGGWKGGAGIPSPMSPTPSPASVGSTGSQGSANGDGRITNPSAMSSPGVVSVPQKIHSSTQQYFTITNYLVQSHEWWEQADMHMIECKDFYRDIEQQCGSLSMHGSLADLVKYVRYAVGKLKDS